MHKNHKPSSRWTTTQLSIILGCFLVITALLSVIAYLLMRPTEVEKASIVEGESKNLKFKSHHTELSVDNATETTLKAIASTEETIKANANRTTGANTLPPATPCDDFYRYACDKWENDNPIPEDMLKINTFSNLDKEIKKYIWRIFSNSSYATNDIHLSDVRKFYKSCVERNNILPEEFRSQVRQIIAKTYGHWELLPSTRQTVSVSSDGGKKLSLLDLYLPLISTSGGSPLFSLNIYGKYPPVIEEESLVIAPFYNKYAHFLGVPETEVKRLNSAFELSFRLAHNTYYANRHAPNKGKQLVKMDELKAICPPMDWENLFAKLFDETEYKGDYRLLPIIVEDKMALKHQCALHEIEMSTTAGRSALHNMAVMELFLPLLSFVSSKRDKSVPMDSKADTDLNPKYSEFCLERLMEVFPWTIEKHYLAQRIKDSHRNEVVNIFKEIKETLYTSIEEVTWLNDRTKKFAIDKISNITVVDSSYDVNISEFKENLSLIYRYPIEENTYIVNEHFARKSKHLDNLRRYLFGIPEELEHYTASHTTKAYYTPNRNRIHIHAGLLNPPYYSHGKEDSVIYGGLGWVIAHELLHAVDTTGLLVDEKGDDLPSSVSYQGFLEILKQTECMRKRHRDYKFTSEKSGGVLTQGEIISDHGGVKAAYRTYHRLKKKNPPQVVNETSNSPYTSDQLFFLTFAQTLCGYHSVTGLLKQVKDIHVLNFYRVNDVLLNNEDFSRAYNCPFGSPMNPRHKCHVW